MSPSPDSDRFLSATPSPFAPTGSGDSPSKPRREHAPIQLGPARLAAATGRVAASYGRTGAFTGTYQLERFVSQFGQLAAVGVFTGTLVDADGSEIGVGSRQQTVAVEVTEGPTGVVARLGPVDVNLIGFLRVDEIAVDLPPTAAGNVEKG